MVWWIFYKLLVGIIFLIYFWIHVSQLWKPVFVCYSNFFLLITVSMNSDECGYFIRRRTSDVNATLAKRRRNRVDMSAFIWRRLPTVFRRRECVVMPTLTRCRHPDVDTTSENGRCFSDVVLTFTCHHNFNWPPTSIWRWSDVMCYWGGLRIPFSFHLTAVI